MKKMICALLFLNLLVVPSLFGKINHSTLWKFAAGNKILSSPIVHNGVIYLGSDDKNFYAISETDGKEIWRFKTDGIIRGMATIFEGKIAFVSRDGYLYLLNLADGKLIWKFASRGEKQYDPWDYYSSKPEVVGNIICFGSGDNFIYGVDKNNGNKIWEVKTNGIVHSSAAVIDKNVFFGSFDGNVYSINSENGNINWKFKTLGNYSFPKGEVQGSVAVFGKFLAFGSRDYNLYVIKAVDGTTVGNDMIKSWIVSKPTVSDKSLFFGNSDNTFLWCYNPYEPDKNWKTRVSLNVFADAVIYKDYVIFGSFNGRIYFVNKNDGKIANIISTEASLRGYNKIFDENDMEREEVRKDLNTLEAYDKLYNVTYFSLGAIVGTPCVNRDMLYVPTTDGLLYAYKLN